MNRKTRLILTTAAAAIALPLAACSGGDDGGDYCGAVQEAKDISAAGADLTTDDVDPAALKDFAASLQTIADAAPDEVAADWKTGADYMSAAVAAFENPEEIDEETQQLLSDDESIDATMETVEKHAMDECDIDLSQD